MCPPALGGRIQVEFDEFDNTHRVYILSQHHPRNLTCQNGGKQQWWYQHLICLDIAQDIIYIVHDLDENSDEINPKKLMLKSTKGSMMTYTIT